MMEGTTEQESDQLRVANSTKCCYTCYVCILGYCQVILTYVGTILGEIGL